MVAPIIAALGRAAMQAAKQAAKSAAKSSIKTSAGNLVKRDISTAKNRYLRASKRYDIESKLVGERSRYGQLLKKASYRTEKLAQEVSRTDFKDPSARELDLISQSGRYLVKATRSKIARGDLLGETLLNGTMQGHRLMSVTRDLWENVGYENRFQAIKEAFGDKSLSEIILQIEKDTGVNIMKGDINSKQRYGALSMADRLRVEQYIISNYG